MTQFLPPINSIYVHFPICAHLCNYCDFHKKLKEVDYSKQIQSVEELLSKQFDAGKQFLATNELNFGELETLYVGGGTPSLWGERGAKYMGELLKKHEIKLRSDCEFTMEVNPGTLDKNVLQAWKSIGMNRVSVGIQTLDETRLPLLDRYHSIDESHQALSRLQQEKVNFSADLMIGLPETKALRKRQLAEEINKIADYGPSHFSVYILTVKENYKNYNQLPVEDAIVEEYQLVVETLASLGYQQYEVSNFAQPGKHSRHNWKYWASESVAAFGPSATGYVVLAPNEKALRYKWATKDESFDLEILNSEELKMEVVYLKLRVGNVSAAISELSQDKQQQLLAKWAALGYLELHTLNWKGYLLIDSIVQDIYDAN